MPPPQLETYDRILVLGVPQILRTTLEPQFTSKGAVFEHAGQIVQNNKLPPDINAIVYFTGLTDNERRVVSRLAEGMQLVPANTPHDLESFLRTRLKGVAASIATDKISPGLRQLIDHHIPNRGHNFNVNMILKRAKSSASRSGMKVDGSAIMAYILEVRRARQERAAAEQAAQSGGHHPHAQTDSAPAAQDVPTPPQTQIVSGDDSAKVQDGAVQAALSSTNDPEDSELKVSNWRNFIKLGGQGTLQRFVQDNFDPKTMNQLSSVRAYVELVSSKARQGGFPDVKENSVAVYIGQCKKAYEQDGGVIAKHLTARWSVAPAEAKPQVNTPQSDAVSTAAPSPSANGNPVASIKPGSVAWNVYLDSLLPAGHTFNPEAIGEEVVQRMRDAGYNLGTGRILEGIQELRRNREYKARQSGSPSVPTAKPVESGQQPKAVEPKPPTVTSTPPAAVKPTTAPEPVAKPIVAAVEVSQPVSKPSAAPNTVAQAVATATSQLKDSPRIETPHSLDTPPWPTRHPSRPVGEPATAKSSLVYSELTDGDKWRLMVGLIQEFREILFEPPSKKPQV